MSKPLQYTTTEINLYEIGRKVSGSCWTEEHIRIHVPASGLPRKAKTNLSWNRLQVGVGTVETPMRPGGEAHVRGEQREHWRDPEKEEVDGG